MKIFFNKKNKIIVLVIFIVVILLLGIKLHFKTNSLEEEAITESKPLALNWLSYDEGLLKAEKENKYILIDFYGDSCGWCKKLDKEVYSNEEVKKVLLDKFVTIRVNTGSQNKVEENGQEITEKKLAALYQVSGLPTTWFLESNHKRIAPLPGYAPAPQFIKVLNYIGGGWYKMISFKEYLEKNES